MCLQHLLMHMAILTAILQIMGMQIILVLCLLHLFHMTPCLSAAAENTVSPPVQDKPPVQAPFWICFVKGNISRCSGCKKRIGQLPPPEDIVLQHKEKVVFLNSHTGIYQLSCDLCNIYYHALKDCVCAHFNDFDANVYINVDYSVKVLLSDVHVQHMLDESNLHL